MRSPLYALTPQGRTLYQQADALGAAMADELASLIPVANARTAMRTLETMLRQLQIATLSSEVES